MAWDKCSVCGKSVNGYRPMETHQSGQHPWEYKILRAERDVEGSQRYSDISTGSLVAWRDCREWLSTVTGMNTPGSVTRLVEREIEQIRGRHIRHFNDQGNRTDEEITVYLTQRSEREHQICEEAKEALGVAVFTARDYGVERFDCEECGKIFWEVDAHDLHHMNRHNES